MYMVFLPPETEYIERITFYDSIVIISTIFDLPIPSGHIDADPVSDQTKFLNPLINGINLFSKSNQATTNIVMLHMFFNFI